MSKYQLSAKSKTIHFPKKLKGLLAMAPFIISDKVEGQAIADDSKLILGLRCGPLGFDIKSLIHEIAHFVEIDEKRMFLKGWGLNVPRKFIFNQYCVDPRTNQATMRELRVGAIQMNILLWLNEKGYTTFDSFPQDYCAEYVTDLFSLDNEIQNFVKSMNWMPDWLMIPGKGDDGRKLWMTNKIKKFMKVYTIEWFLKRWENRCKLAKQKFSK